MRPLADTLRPKKIEDVFLMDQRNAFTYMHSPYLNKNTIMIPVYRLIFSGSNILSYDYQVIPNFL